MQEYLDAGVKLGWLINPQQQQVEIYRLGQSKDVKQLLNELRGETTLINFSQLMNHLATDWMSTSNAKIHYG